MNATIKNLILAGIGGAVTYGVVKVVVTALVPTTALAADLLVHDTVPIVLAAAVIWIIIAAAFRD